MGYEAYEAFCFAIATDNASKGTDIYKTMVTAFGLKDSFKINNIVFCFFDCAK